MINQNGNSAEEVQPPVDLRSDLPKDYPYWANETADKLVPQLLRKINNYNLYLITSGTLARMRASYQQYYKAVETNGALLKTGQNNEYRMLHINHFRNVIANVLSQITQSKPAWQPKSTNSDTKTQRQTLIAINVLNHYMYQMHIADLLKRAVEIALVAGHADISLEFDKSLGNPITGDVENNRIVNEGDIVSEVFDPTNAIFDPCYADVKNCPWRILRRFVSKQDLMYKYPDNAAAIDSARIDGTITPYILDNLIWTKITMNNYDVVPVYYFYHRKSSAIPKGRLVIFCGNEVLDDSELPYPDVPVMRINASDHINNGFGWTFAYDLLEPQAAYDKACSMILTNLAAWGLSVIAAPRGSSSNVIPNLGGMTLIEYNEGSTAPAALNLGQSNQGEQNVYTFLDRLENNIQKMAGVNSVTVGDPAASLKSGAALAMIASQSLIFNSPLANNYTSLLENVGTQLISILKLYATTPRMIEIAGIANKSSVDEFTNQDLSNVTRVQVDQVSALSKTLAGRLQIASELLQSGQISSADYIQVLQTGDLNGILEKVSKKEMSIRAENEELLAGKPVRVILTDDHKAHVDSHKTVLDDPAARVGTPEAQKLQELVLAHINEHIQTAQNTPPALAIFLGQQPMNPGMGAPGASPVVTPPPAAGPGASVQPAKLPNMPQGAPDQNKQVIENAKTNLTPPAQ